MLRSKSSLVSHVFKYRDRVTIIIDILNTVKNSGGGRRKTQIMQSANLNYMQMKRYLNYLTNRGLVLFTEKQTYTITNKGSKFLQFAKMQKT